MVVIPTRLSASRFPDKPLCDLHGKPMIAHVWHRAFESQCGDVFVATPDAKIQQVLDHYHGKVIMTSSHHKTGSDRIVEAVEKNGESYDYIVNFQGDLPIFPSGVLKDCVSFLHQNLNFQMITLVQKISVADIAKPQVVKVAWSSINENERWGQCFYFSRQPIAGYLSGLQYFKHIGVYVYRKSALLQWSKRLVSPLEKIEDIEALRCIEMGWKVGAMYLDEDIPIVSVDVPSDAEIIRKSSAFKALL